MQDCIKIVLSYLKYLNVNVYIFVKEKNNPSHCQNKIIKTHSLTYIIITTLFLTVHYLNVVLFIYDLDFLLQIIIFCNLKCKYFGYFCSDFYIIFIHFCEISGFNFWQL